MKYQVLFSLKNNEKIFMNVVCCSRDWRFKGLETLPFSFLSPFTRGVYSILKAPITTAADDIDKYFFIVLQRK